MNRIRKVVALGAIGAVFALGAGPAPAAEPEGTVSPASKSYKWTSGPHIGANATADGVNPCLDPAVEAEVCDIRYVQIDLPPAGGDVTFTFTPNLPVCDYDPYVYDPDGKLVAGAAGTITEPVETLRTRLTKSGVYTIKVAYFTVPGASYDGEVKLK